MISSLLNHRFAAVVLSLFFLSIQPLSASIITQTYSGPFEATVSGTLPNQGTALLENFTIPTTSALTISTTSYATGGFQPNLLLYDSLGNFVSAGSPAGFPDPATQLIGDTTLSAVDLPPGVYTIALMDFLLNQSITATNLSDGFTANYGSGTTFTDAGGNLRDGDYSFTINVTPTPEPTTLVLALLGGLALLAWRQRK